jgi:myo-inositol 2-dehydrogenase / D-chiro-inositol 1-dehydrogenase
MLKICLIGAGDWATHMHGPALAQYAAEHAEEVMLAAVCEPGPPARGRAFAAQFGFQRSYTDLDEMLDQEQPGACWCLTPISATFQVVSRLLERGVPVLLEKPPGANSQETQELAALAQRTGTPNMVAFNRRQAPCTRKALEWIANHAPAEYLYARMLRDRRLDEAFAFGTGIHVLDGTRALGEASGGKLLAAKCARIKSVCGVWNFHVDLKFESGLQARCDILPSCGLVDERYTVYGADWTASYSLPWEGSEGRAELWVKGELREEAVWPADPPYRYSGIYDEAAAFLAALREGRTPKPSLAESVASVALAEAVQAGRDIVFS